MELWNNYNSQMWCHYHFFKQLLSITLIRITDHFSNIKEDKARTNVTFLHYKYGTFFVFWTHFINSYIVHFYARPLNNFSVNISVSSQRPDLIKRLLIFDSYLGTFIISTNERYEKVVNVLLNLVFLYIRSI